MKFCEVCNNLLHPRENRELKKLEYVCKSSVCNYIDSSEVEEGLVYRNDVVKDTATNLRAILSDNNKDPTLTRSTGRYHTPYPHSISRTVSREHAVAIFFTWKY